MCPVTFFAFCRQVRWRVWRGCRPSLDFSSGFWAVPDPYGTIPGRNRADQHFFIMRQADAFWTSQEFQNEQNRSKNDTKSENPILRGWDASVTSWMVQGRLKHFSCEFLRFCKTNYHVAERIYHSFAENPHTTDLWSGAIFDESRFDQTAYLPMVAPSPARLVLVKQSRLFRGSEVLRSVNLLSRQSQ